MQFTLKLLLFFLLFTTVIFECVLAEGENEFTEGIRAPHKNVGNSVIDGTGTEKQIIFEKTNSVMGERKGSYNRVSVSTVALFTLAMASAAGLGALPFFFVGLDPQWAGMCNGMAAGVMLAASFDLIIEGQEHGAGNWVVIGILAGSIFIFLCKKFLEQYGEVSMLDIKGADATKVVLVIGIMTLYSFGGGLWCWSFLCWLKRVYSRSFGYFGYSCAQHTRGISCEYGACLERCVSTECNAVECDYILTPASPSPVASAATLSVAFMEALSVLFQNSSHEYNSEDASGFFVSLLFGLGPLLGGLFLVSFVFHHALVMSAASGIALVLGDWRPSQLVLSSKTGFIPLMSLLALGAAFAKVSGSNILALAGRKRSSVDDLPAITGFPVALSAITLQSVLACGAVCHELRVRGSQDAEAPTQVPEAEAQSTGLLDWGWCGHPLCNTILGCWHHEHVQEGLEPSRGGLVRGGGPSAAFVGCLAQVQAWGSGWACIDGSRIKGEGLSA